MTLHESNGLRFHQFEIFSSAVTQAVFTRRGGVSPAPWNSLNLGGSVGDSPAHVAENRLRIFDALGRAHDSIHDVWLVHGTDIVYADEPRPLDSPPERADILLTDNPQVSLFMRFADCVPLLFHDPIKKVIGISHAGWMGTVKGVAQVTVDAMQIRYGSRPEDILAGIGPSIGVDHYEVGAEVIGPVEKKFGKAAAQILHQRGNSTYFDLWKANLIQLNQAGVHQVEVAGICTACQLEDWFSHRAEKGRTGRFGVLMALT